MLTLGPALASGFLRSADLFSSRPALEVGGEVITYDELRNRATEIALTLMSRESDATGPPLTAVFASRSSTAFAAILGVLLRGHGYVPLNPRFPAHRNRVILDRAGCRAVVVDGASAGAAREAMSGLQEPLLVVLPDAKVSRAERQRWAPHAAVGGNDFDGASALPDSRPADPAYLLFTSGSTGTPKGVLVRHENVRAFLDAVEARYEVNEDDRLSQMFDLTFDLSVFDMFVAWEHGACVCCPDTKQLLRPSHFIRDSALTVWFSVPSVGMFLHRLGVLKPGAFPTLRLSLFCGEALPSELAAAWATAAPNSSVDNLYGPTEATIACTVQRWDEQTAQGGINGLVPIGTPLGATRVRVVDASLRDVAPGRPGELLLSGPQVVEGYWRDETATARSFVSHPALGHSYLTGDRVVQQSPEGPLAYLGRVDSQIKVLGHRVELGEVEAVIREEASADAVALGWPRTSSGAAGIVAFVADRSIDPQLLRERIAARLPDYMVPRELRLLSELPLTANGKRDRNALIALLECD
jgi:amino acid adenylation domain-containing protein